MKRVKLGIPGQVQESNASLAIALVQEHLKSLKLPLPDITPTSLPSDIITALGKAQWPGRCETRFTKGITWYCDGAHTAESVAAAAQWYSSMYSRCLTTLIVARERLKRRKFFYLINRRATQKFLYKICSRILTFISTKPYFVAISHLKRKGIKMVLQWKQVY